MLEIQSVLLTFLSKTDFWLIPCPFKYFTHLDCPGCGFQRSILALCAGDLKRSFAIYPPAIPFLFSAMMGLGERFLNWQINPSLLKVCYVVTGLLILANYIFKIATRQLY